MRVFLCRRHHQKGRHHHQGGCHHHRGGHHHHQGGHHHHQGGYHHHQGGHHHHLRDCHHHHGGRHHHQGGCYNQRRSRNHQKAFLSQSVFFKSVIIQSVFLRIACLLLSFASLLILREAEKQVRKSSDDAVVDKLCSKEVYNEIHFQKIHLVAKFATNASGIIVGHSCNQCK